MMKKKTATRSGIAYPTLVLLVCCALLGTSCVGDGEGLNSTGDLPGTGLDDIQAIFDAKCVLCHITGGIGYIETGGSGNNGLDLTAAASFSSLVDQPTFRLPDTQPRWRVMPGEPDNSYLLQKVSSDSPKFGSRMPLGGPYLTPGEIGKIRQWIEEGALGNSQKEEQWPTTPAIN